MPSMLSDLADLYYRDKKNGLMKLKQTKKRIVNKDDVEHLIRV
jgi:hypothetical protein